MTKKAKIIALCVYWGLLIICLILGTVYSDNEFIVGIFYCAFFLLILFGVVVVLVVFFAVRNKDKKLMQSFIENKDYITAKRVFELKDAGYLAYGSKIVAKYYVLVSCFALNDIETARELLDKTYWGFMRDYIKYYEILLNLKDNNLELARNNYAILAKNAKKIQALQVNKLKQIFACIDTNNFEDEFYSDSVNPIVKEIYDFYLSQSTAAAY